MNVDRTYFQRLAWRIVEALPDRGCGRAVLVTSARHGEGRSYIAAALASALSDQSPRPVALCDCAPPTEDLPPLPRTAPAHGSGSDLVPAAAMDLTTFEAKSPGAVVRLPFGRGDPATLYQGAGVQRAVDLLRGHFGFVVLDGPLLADCGPLSESTDGTLLVVNSSHTRREIVKGSLQASPRIQQKMLGAVLNESPRYIPRWLYRRAL